MQDRTPTYPGRVTLTPVPGQANKYDMVRADEPTQTGDAINKANLLTDATASKINTNLGATAPTTVNEALNALAYVPIKVSTGSYTGTGTYGASNPNSVTIPSGCKYFDMHTMVSSGSKFAFSSFGATWDLSLATETYSQYNGNYGGTTNLIMVKLVGNVLYWYNTTDASKQFNASNITYYYRCTTF